MSYPVQIWSEGSYAGQQLSLDYGTYPDVSKVGFFHDIASSIKVAPFTRVVMYTDGLSGQSMTIDGPAEIAYLGTYRTGFNDVLSSLIVTKLQPTIQEQLDCCNGVTSSFKCGSYQPGTITCNTTYAQYCTNPANTGSEFCKSWCMKNPSICDQAVINYCELNPTDQYCSCIKSPANEKGIINPKCVDLQCLKSGYLTTNMQSTNCPSIIDCNVNVALANSGVQLSSMIPIQQNCGDGTKTTTVTSPIPQPNQQSQSADSSSNMIYILIMFLIILFVAIVGGAIYFEVFDDMLSDDSS